jgi:carbamoyltransferase
MKILGINHDMYITSAALIEDGKIIAAIPEERLTRRKQTREFPINAIKYCLDVAECGIDDISYIANSYNPGAHLEKFHPAFSNNRRFRGDYLYSVPDNLFKLLASRDKASDYIFQEIGLEGSRMKIYFIDHHLCHAANGFYLSPFKSAAIVTADGRGELCCGSFCIGRNNKIRTLKNIKIPHSVGSFYSTFTSYLGFNPDSDEWKVMALSAFGKKDSYYKNIRNLIEFKDDGTFELNLNYFSEHNQEQGGFYSTEFLEMFGPERVSGGEILQRHFDIATAMQAVTEDILTHMINWIHDESGQENLVVSGGSFMNSVYNGKITERTAFENVFISSCPDDSGLSIGSALYLYNDILGHKERFTQKHNYYGPEYSDEEIRATLQKYKMDVNYEEDICGYASNALSCGRLIGWFQGKMEFGQRALGNRSILADPRDPSIKEKINNAVKYREEFRPFAPAVLEEFAKEFFEIDDGEAVKFMEKVYPIRKSQRKLIPAVTHVDGSGRLQTVNEEDNPLFYRLIKNFHAATGIPIVLNTSFNVNKEPIVCSPTDALKTFYGCGLDILIIGNYVITK